MKLFLSWSGELSHKVATALHKWIPYVIQLRAALPFCPAEVISAKGSDGARCLPRN